MTTHATELLEQLANVEAQAALINIHFDDLRKTILTEEVQAQLAEIEAERAETIKSVAAGIETLREQIKMAVLANGSTVKGSMFQAVYVKGRDSWDTKALDGYATAHPEIMPFRTTGNPSVTIRGVK